MGQGLWVMGRGSYLFEVEKREQERHDVTNMTLNEVHQKGKGESA